MLRYYNNPSVDKTFSYIEAVKKYKGPSVKKYDEQFGSEEKESEQKSGGSGSRRPQLSSLVDICLTQIANNFEKHLKTTVPVIQSSSGESYNKYTSAELEHKLISKLIERDTLASQAKNALGNYAIGMDEKTNTNTNTKPIDLEVSASYIHNDDYWKYCCEKKESWNNVNPIFHGLTYKQTFFELYCQELLENFDPIKDKENDLYDALNSSEDFVFNLTLRQLPSHMDLQQVFKRLPNLSKLSLTYGIRRVGIDYERALFGLKILDAENLAKCIKATDVLTSLELPCNLMDDQLLTILMAGLINNNTVTNLDLSHNKITNNGARLISKLLGRNSVLSTLNLADNQIHAEGGKFIGRALKHNESLIELNLSLNRLTDDGGRALIDGISKNK
eukprot:g2878.t1